MSWEKEVLFRVVTGTNTEIPKGYGVREAGPSMKLKEII